MSSRVYFDHHSTTPIDPEVLQAVVGIMQNVYGNPSSRSHEEGWVASTYVEKAREQIAHAIGAEGNEIFFTSGATESNNWALSGLMRAHLAHGKKHLIITSAEHRSVRDVAHELDRWGFELTELSVDSTGKIDPLKIEKAIRPETVLVSAIYGNNEIGTLNPITEIGEICRSNKILFHTDATQAFGRVKIDVKEQSIDLMSMSAHKIYGPKGVGALFVRRGGRAFPFESILFGGQQERGLRPGTLNVSGIVGFGKAAELAVSRLDIDSKKIAQLRDYLWIEMQKKIQGCRRNGDEQYSLPNNLSVTIEGVPADPLMMQMRDFAFSAGAACSSADPKPSGVLLSLGLSPENAKSTIRLGLGRGNTAEEVDRFVEELSIAVGKIRCVQNLGDQYYGKPNSVNG